MANALLNFRGNFKQVLHSKMQNSFVHSIMLLSLCMQKMFHSCFFFSTGSSLMPQKKNPDSLELIRGKCGRIFGDVSILRKFISIWPQRPQLEYATELWSPEQVTCKRMLEKVQRRATKFILDYPPLDYSYTERLVQLNLLHLEHRRKCNDLIFLFKCQNGLYDLDISNSVKNVLSDIVLSLLVRITYVRLDVILNFLETLIFQK